jgi:gag-polyprotein putative aspartyl protease
MRARLVPFSFVAALAILALPAQAADAPGYYASRAGLDADHALLMDAWSGKPETIDRLRARLAETPAPSIAADGWSFLCNFEEHAGRYAQSASACAKAVAVDPHGGDANTLALVERLAGLPPPRSYGTARVPVTAGVHIPVRAGAYAGTAMADTGAEISVMMQSVARDAHVRILGASREVGSTTGAVTGQIGLLPEVMIGDGVVKNLPVLVLPDAQLILTDGKEVVKLPFVLSLYAMAGFGRVAWLDHDKFLVLGRYAPEGFAGAVPMIWHPRGIAVPLDGPGGRRTAHFDSGANVSYLFDRALPLISDAERAQIVESTRKIGGVSGVVEEKIRKLPAASFTLAGQSLVLRNVDVAAAPETGEAARLGEDVLADYGAVVFDFEKMQFSISP